MNEENKLPKGQGEQENNSRGNRQRKEKKKAT